MSCYLVTAYKWGSLNDHQYQVYCGPDRAQALLLGECEPDHRGGKYGCAVYEWDETGQDCKLIAYFDAMGGDDPEPTRNWRRDYYLSLGVLLESWSEGPVLLHDPDSPFLKPSKLDSPPAEILAEIKRKGRMYEALTRLEGERIARLKTGETNQ